MTGMVLKATLKDKDDNEVPYIEGRVYGLKAWETPQGSRTSRGSHIRNILGLKDDEHVVSIIPLNKELIEEPTGHFLAFATRKGVIKKSNISDYVKINRKGKKAINLAADDELVTVRSGTDEHNVVMVSNHSSMKKLARKHQIPFRQVEWSNRKQAEEGARALMDK